MGREDARNGTGFWANKEDGMRSRGIGRAFIVPTATAGLIIWIIYFSPHAERAQVSKHPTHPNPQHLPSTASRAQPWTLFDEERRYGKWTPVPVTIPQRDVAAATDSNGIGSSGFPELSQPPSPGSPSLSQPCERRLYLRTRIWQGFAKVRLLKPRPFQRKQKQLQTRPTR